MQGKPGPQGCKGHRGFQGDIGVGVQGVKGHKGEDGERGCKGNQGMFGPQGKCGKKGTQGDIGPQGASSTNNIYVFLSTYFSLNQNFFFGQASTTFTFANSTLVVPINGFITGITANMRDNGSRGMVGFQVYTSGPDGSGAAFSNVQAFFDSSVSASGQGTGNFAVSAGDLFAIKYTPVDDVTPLGSGANATIVISF